MITNKKTIKRIIFTILTVIWLIIIFLFSNQNVASSQKLSDSFIDKTIIKIYEKFNENVDDADRLIVRDSFSNPVRKFAHFSIYFILGILVLITLNEYDVNKKYLIYYSIIFCFLYAASDEIHQLFVAGRGGSVKDVILDTLGSISSIFILKHRVVK